MTETERMDGIFDLSEIWKYAGEIFPYFEEKEIDWDGAYRKYLERVFDAGSVKEIHLLMAEFLNLLGDGHTDYRFPAALLDETGFLPFRLVFFGGDWLIGEALPGMEEFFSAKILSVNGIGIQEFLEKCFRYIYHVGAYAAPERLRWIMPFLLKKCGNELVTSKGVMQFDLAEKEQAKTVGAGQDIPSKKPRMHIYEKNNKKVLYVRMDCFTYEGAAEEIKEELLRQLKNTVENSLAGVILDIRNNIGGMTAYAANVAELFISGEFSACSKKTRVMKGIDLSSASQYARMEEEQLQHMFQSGLCTQEEVERCLRTAKNICYYEYRDAFGAPEHKAVFDGPVILLTARGTISAAEDFTAMFKSTRRAVLMGEATFGSTGTPFLKHLRLGGSIRICSVGYRLSDGTEFIGKGIEPDIFIAGCAQDFVFGDDKVLKKALEML